MKTDPKKTRMPAAIRTRRGVALWRKVLAALLAGCMACGPAWANPTGAQIVNGQVSIRNSGNILTVTNSPGAIINWQSFSISQGELTRFLQQSASSAVLNRIVGQSPSQIFGALQSNGKVYLINPNGIMFGGGSRINVGGLVASSLDISNADFLAGRGSFRGTAQAGAVVNQGSITTPSGGQVYLIAPHVENTGIVTSPQGEVLLAAGHSVQLADSADPNTHVVISAPADQALNLGQVVAQGGKIGIYGALINQNGIVSADSMEVGANGQIVFKASQTTTLAGDSRTTATGSGSGGSIFLLGDHVGLTDHALVDASGQTGGGTVLVGGDYRGANPAVRNATATYVGADTSIKADAIQNGNGGKVIVWSENATRAYGSISAQGGAQGGNGGFVETSGHYLDVSGIQVNAGAPRGNGGSWLLDPYDITIDASTSNVNTSTASGTTTYTGIPPGTSAVSASTIGTTLSGGTSVVVDTASGVGTDFGDITVLSAINSSNSVPVTLTLKANRNITVGAGIAATSLSTLGVTLTADQLNTGTGDVNVNANITTAGGGLTIKGGAIGLTGQLDAGAGAIKLTAGAGGIANDSETGLITGNTLELNSVGTVAITGYNNFNRVAANVTGAGNFLTVENSASGGLTIDTVGSTTGVSATRGIIINQYTNGGINVARNVTSSENTFSNAWVSLQALYSTGDIIFQNGVTVSGNSIHAYSMGGGITIGGPINAVTSATLEGAGSVIQVTGGLVTASSLTVQGGAAGIGTSTTPLLTNVSTLISANAYSASSPGGVYIKNSSAALDVRSIYSGGVVNVNSAGSLTIPNCTGECSTAVYGDVVKLSSQGAMTIGTISGPSAITANSIELYAGYTSAGGAAMAPSVLTVNGVLAGPSISLFAGDAINYSGTPSVRMPFQFQAVAAPPPPPPPPPPTLAECVANPTLAGCDAVLPTLAQCTATPTAAGCSAVLPTVAECTARPIAPGCSVVLPTLAQCTASPSLAGCSVVLPTLAQCTTTPTAPGCSVVLPTLAQCTASPTLAGCSVVLPTLAQCTATPTAPGCSVVLPTLAQCTVSPTLAGCSAVLPTVAQCTAAPTAPGCSVVLPTLAQCTASPTLAGCSVVLPTLAQCTATPSAPGCSVVLPSLAQCVASPGLAGCSVVLPTIAACTVAPSTTGCSVVLPTLARCVATPTLAGCSVVLPTLAQCVATPTAPGCSVVLPTLAQCTASPSLAGCSVILPTLAQCTAAPTLQGCSAVLPTLAQCASTPSAAGCSVVLPTPVQFQSNEPVTVALNTTINLINATVGSVLYGPAQGGTKDLSNKKDDKKDIGKDVSGTTKTGAKNEDASKKMYCN